jgi:hypothetical protein
MLGAKDSDAKRKFSIEEVAAEATTLIVAGTLLSIMDREHLPDCRD